MNRDIQPGIDTVPPVEKRVRLRLGAAEAFDVFTREIARWWPLRSYACKPDEAVSVTIEPGVGQAVYETDRSGQQYPWGKVLQWDPPHGFTMTWHPGQPEEHATRVSVRFSALADGGCELCLVHDGWHARGEGAATARDNYDTGWVAVLDRFAEAANRSA